MHEQKQRLSENLNSFRFDAKALPEIIKAEHKDKLQAVHDQIQSLENEELKAGLTTEFESYRAWRNAKPTVDQRKKNNVTMKLSQRNYGMPLPKGHISRFMTSLTSSKSAESMSFASSVYGHDWDCSTPLTSIE